MGPQLPCRVPWLHTAWTGHPARACGPLSQGPAKAAGTEQVQRGPGAGGVTPTLGVSERQSR